MEKILNKKQIKYLKKIAQDIDPVVYIGKVGLSENVLSAVDTALNSHELVKIRFINFKNQKKDIASQISKKANAVLVNLIGNTAVMYRQNIEANKRKIFIPSSL